MEFLVQQYVFPMSNGDAIAENTGFTEKQYAFFAHCFSEKKP